MKSKDEINQMDVIGHVHWNSTIVNDIIFNHVFFFSFTHVLKFHHLDQHHSHH